MDKSPKVRSLEQLFALVKEGKLDVNEAIEQSKNCYIQDLDFAKIDHHRSLRKGYPEVVFCEGKHIEHATQIIIELAKINGRVLGTRATHELYLRVEAALKGFDVVYHELARVIEVGQPKDQIGHITIVTAGSADIPVAEEAYVTARAMGNHTTKVYDVGVAGLHRLMNHIDEIAKSNVVIVVAGMEGALASVLGGLIDKPLIGVPTAIGYGSHLDGFVPLLAMLNSCATLGVVNIGNGFGAAVLASQINHLVSKKS
ncbi:MAG: nickel pincer cofactor biosynthesis protein LarB [Methylotenera sp.]|uniref:nickel pincer cofactor biosynthesis protein LarB n=1 Tax=Methylotenera sp. TaxID=2051956 RepID=UPI0027274048|nr:nickel pincer cofactor biosynthesis protein LarB [Methylotenera sp.]MDO9150506.1 nickel pincer cofactor biosynthesis protein LarB [Methylotenera sp.]